MAPQPGPAHLWEDALYAIDSTLEHPHDAHYMPKAPALSSGIIAFPPSLDAKWLEHLASVPNKALLKAVAAKCLRKPGWDYVPQESSVKNQMRNARLIKVYSSWMSYYIIITYLS